MYLQTSIQNSNYFFIQVAKEVGEATLNMLSKMSTKNLQILLSFLHHSKSTAVFEVLQPTYQHVVDLSYLPDGKRALKFITWTSAFKNESENIVSYCSIRPDKVSNLKIKKKLKSKFSQKK